MKTPTLTPHDQRTPNTAAITGVQPVLSGTVAIEHETNKEILDAIDHAHQQLIAAEIGELVGIIRAADRWKIDSDAVGAGTERMLQAGHDGTPSIAEFLALELGALLGITPRNALARIGNALDLRHRHPTLWTAVLEGKIRVWQANKICLECSHLPYRTALKLDTTLTESIEQLPWTRIIRALPGHIIQADPKLAREREQARRDSRRIRISNIEDGHVNLFGVIDAADGITFNEVLNQVATLFPAQPDRPLQRDIDRRRSLAFGIITHHAYNTYCADQPPLDLSQTNPQTMNPAPAPSKSMVPTANTSPDTPLPTLDQPRNGETTSGRPLNHDPHSDQPTTTTDQSSSRPTHKPMPCTLIVHISAHDPALTHTNNSNHHNSTNNKPTSNCSHSSRSDTNSSNNGDSDRNRSNNSDSNCSTGVARVEGWGPLLTERLPEFLAGAKVTVRPIIDPNDIRPVDCYETPATMRFALNQRNPVDAFPYGTLKASKCDADHTIAYINGKPGQTHLGNLGPLSRKTHRAKTHGKWKLEQPIPGVYHWTSPHGYQYRATANGAIRLTVPNSG